jgi:hypothetical protein
VLYLLSTSCTHTCLSTLAASGTGSAERAVPAQASGRRGGGSARAGQLAEQSAGARDPALQAAAQARGGWRRRSSQRRRAAAVAACEQKTGDVSKT